MADTAYTGAVLLALARIERKLDNVAQAVGQAQEGGRRAQN